MANGNAVRRLFDEVPDLESRVKQLQSMNKTAYRTIVDHAAWDAEYENVKSLIRPYAEPLQQAGIKDIAWHFDRLRPAMLALARSSAGMADAVQSLTHDLGLAQSGGQR